MEVYTVKQILVKHKILLTFAVDLILLIMYLFSFTYGRFFVTLFFFILSIINIFTKKAGLVFINLSITFILYMATNPALDFYYRLEGLRFSILQNQYNNIIEETLPNLDDCMELNHQDINNPFLCDDSKVFYQKDNGSVFALFTTGSSGNVTGYIYCSDENAWALASKYDFCSKINDHWATFKMYPLKI